MISHFVWPQALVLFIVPAVLLSFIAEAKVDTLFTSSVTYCSPPDAILIQEFSMIYYAFNNSVKFNISAANVIPDLKVRANILLNVYGMQPVNVTADFCQVFGAALCPLPMYDFIGSGFLEIPPSIQVASKIPGVAYKIPDLEAYGQLMLTDISTGNVTACIQATLSNGWSSRQTAVSFVTGIIAILALFSSLVHSFPSSHCELGSVSTCGVPSVAPAFFVDFVLLIQQIATTGLLHLNFPLVYRAFTQNFAWSLGLFPDSQSIQRGIDFMRKLTGGHMQNGVRSPIVYVNRRLSPYNAPIPAGTSPDTNFRYARAAFSVANRSLVARDATTDLNAGAGPPLTVTNSAEDILPAGIPVYVNSLKIGTANAFMSVFFTVLLGVVVASLLGIMYALWTLKVKRSKSGKWRSIVHAELRWFAVSNGIRFAMVVLYPVLVFTFLQWTLDDSWLAVIVSILLLLCTVAALLYPAVCIMLIASHDTEHTLYTTPAYLHTLGTLYIPFRQNRFYFFLPFLAAALFKSMFISFAKTMGITQAVAFLLIETGLLALICVKKPHLARGGEALGIYLAITRVAAAALMFTFVESLRVQAISRVAAGFIIMIIFSIAVIVLSINVILNFCSGLVWRRYGNRPSRPSCGCNSEVKKESLRRISTVLSPTKLRQTGAAASIFFSCDPPAPSSDSSYICPTDSPGCTIPSLYTSEHVGSTEDTPHKSRQIHPAFIMLTTQRARFSSPTKR